jgi:molybdate transport system substrate-binding protein
MKKIIILVAYIITSIQANPQSVKIVAAGNLRYILDDIKTAYAVKNPQVKIDISLGASGALTQQIMNGAGYDIFMAADKVFPDKLKDQGYTTGEVKTYAFGKLVLWSNTVDVSKGLDIITDNEVKRIAIAKPEVAPYGERALECLKYYDLFDKVKDKIVYADNIAQAAQFTQTGNAEIGFLAMALVFAPDMKGTYYILDAKSYKAVEQAMVQIKTWQINQEASKFMNYVLSNDCKPIFEEYGFIVP